MFVMNEKNKAISIVSLILLLLSSALLVQGIIYSNKNLNNTIEMAEDNMNEILASVTNFSFVRYESRIEGLLHTNSQISQAVAQQDRELLYQRVLPKYNSLKKENEYFHVIHFHLADGTTLLRMHDPDFYGDNLTNIRPIVDAVHRTKKLLTGYEAGRHGVFYRIVYPVFFKEKYVGAIEFGIKAHRVMATLEKRTRYPVSSFFRLESLGQNTSFLEGQRVTLGPYVLNTHGNQVFASLPANLALEGGDQYLTLDQKRYIVHVHPIFKDYQGKSIGGLVVLQDITAAFTAKNVFIVRAVIFTSVLFLISFLALYFTFGKMIGQLVQAEKKASDAREEWERTFDAVPDQVSILDNQHQIVHANKAMAKIHGLSIDELILRKCYQVVHGTDTPPPFCPHVQLLEDHQAHVADYFDDRLQRYFSISVAPLEDKQGVFFGSVHVVRDITNEKLAQEALQEEKNRMQNYLDMVSVMIVAIDANHNVSLINKKGCQLLGYPEEEILGRNWIENFIPEQFRDEVQLVADQLYAGDIEPVEYFENTVLCKNGEERLVAWHNTFIRNDEGKIVSLLSSGSDITEQKRGEEEKVQLETQLKQAQKMESIGTLAGGIAHDFNNILSAIIGYTELSRSAINNPEGIERNITEVLKATERAKSLVRQILTFSRKTDNEKQALQVSLVVKEALKLLRSSLPTTINIKQNIASDALVLADPTQIHQIVMNLCTNAYHAMRETGGILAVELKEIDLTATTNIPEIKVPEGRYIQLAISDSGTGMDEETRLKIFEPYFTTKGLGEGTGLGLAVVHGIVSSYGGSINVYSEPGQGTSFHIYLPIYEGDHADTIPDEQEFTIKGGNETIMLVDDDASIAAISTEILNNQGYDVHTFSNGVQAYQELQQDPEKYDIIITDMTMPFMTGVELAQKAMEIRPNLPVILCTGHSELVNHEKALTMGIKEYCEKPLNSRQLLYTVRKVLDTARLYGIRVLFVDDIQFNIDLAELLLKRYGCLVSAATSGEEALDLLKKASGEFDIIITDQNMPNMTGLELARKSQDICPGISVLLVTGDEDIASGELSESGSVSQVLRKPLDENILTSSMSRTIEKEHKS